MSVPLTRFDHRLLCILSESGGLATGTLCREAGLGGQHAAVRRSLLHMEKLGLVGRLDAMKPVVWLRTRAGSERASDPSCCDDVP